MAQDADLVFLPWVRRGAATAIQAPDRFGADQPGIGAATLTLDINERPDVSVPVAVMGPGHVTGLDGRQVVRTDPAPGSRTFEPNYFPLVEFDEPALPWLFTPAAAGARARLRPWLCLVVLRVQAGIALGAPRLGPLPVLRIDPPASIAAELPDLADSWAWAHGQLAAASGIGEAELLAQLAAHPERSVSRLVCPRILAPDTEYLACVVPAFDLGRKAGLGEEVTAGDEARLEPAWRQDAASVELPVYHTWTFATGSGGDFQSLALKLRARPLREGVGSKPVDVGESGLHAAVPSGTLLRLWGALRPRRSVDLGWPDPAAQRSWEAALVPVLNAPAAVAAADDPLLAPPLYAAAAAGLDRVDPARTARWFEALNLSPVHRAVARLGTRVVQEQQEALMASAWAQAAELERVNRLLRQAECGCWISGSMHRRHLAPMDPAVGLMVLAPAQARMARTKAGSVPETGFAALIADTGLEAAAFGAALRRIARPRGAVIRRVARTAEAPGLVLRTVPVLENLRPALVIRRRSVLPVTMVTLERVAASLVPPRTDITSGEATAEAVAAVAGYPTFAFVAPGADVPPRPPRVRPLPPRPRPTRPLPQRPLPQRPLPQRPGQPPISQPLRRPGDPPEFPEPEEPPVLDPDPPDLPEPVPLVDNAAAQLFRTLAAAHLARANPPFVTPRQLPLPEGTLRAAFDEALARTRPRESFAFRARAMFGIPGPARGEERTFERVGLAPHFPQPMVEPLAEIAQELVLPGLDLVLPNTVVPLETNSAFVEAYLAGLNTEMGRELIWRGFPADLAATYFDRFWDASGSPGRLADIEPIARWGDRRLGDPGGGETFVMLVRSELLLRYPDAVIFATRPGPPVEERHPIFTGGFAPDLRYVGFDIPADEIEGWSIVIQEHPSAPRFGIEVGEDSGGGTYLAPRGENAARVAKAVRQMPVRVTLPAPVLLRPA